MLGRIKNKIQVFLWLCAAWIIGTAQYAYGQGKFCQNVPRGIYILLPAGKQPDVRLMNLKFVDGISVRVRWQDVERKPGKFDWKYLDHIFSLAHKEHKQLFLRLLGGFWSPKWICSKGVPCFEMEVEKHGPFAEAFFKKYGHCICLPRVWNCRYLEYWVRFVKAVGRRYGNRQELVLVHLSGPTFFSAEPIIAHSSKELNFLRKQGFSEEAILRAWRETFQAFKQAFPRQFLSLNIHYIVKGDARSMDKLWTLAYKILKDRLVLQGNWLSPRHVLWLTKRASIPNKDFYQLFVQSKKLGVPLGFQTVAPFTTMAQRRGISMRKLLRAVKGILKVCFRLRINYLEVYPADIANKFLQPLWKRFHAIKKVTTLGDVRI